LTLTTTAVAPTGAHQLTLHAEGGGINRTASLELAVNDEPLPPDFALAVIPPSRNVLQGETVTYTYHLTSINGFDAPGALGTWKK